MSGKLFYSCKENTNNEIPYSNFPKLAPYAAGTIDILCLGFLAFTAYYKTTWRNSSKNDKIRIPLLAFLFVTCLVDVIYSMVVIGFPFYTSFMKPVVVLMFLSTIRANLKTVLYDLKDSSIVLLIIFSFIFFFAFSGFFLFQGSLEGVTTFPDIGTSYYNMLILLTTANFPNVMLPAYNSARSNSIFFLVFLVFGLYFLLNVLLAIVFDNYKKRIEETVLEKQNERHKYIEMYYRCYD